MKVSVVTGVYNQMKTIERLYESLCVNREYLCEWVVCDDGSTDGTWQWIQEKAKLNAITIEGFAQVNKGYRLGRSLNNGLRHVKGDIVFIVMGDSFLQNDTLKVLSETYIPFSAGCGARINVDKDENFVSYDWRLQDRNEEVIGIIGERYPFPWAFFTGNTMILSPEHLNYGGLWPEDYVGYGCEDTDTFFRLWLNKVPLYQYNNVKVNHFDHPGKEDSLDNTLKFNEKVRRNVDPILLERWAKEAKTDEKD